MLGQLRDNPVMNLGPANHHSSFTSLEWMVWPKSHLHWEDDPPPPNADTPPEPPPTPDAADWRTGLDPDIANHPSLKDLKTPADVAKSWVNAQRLIGMDKIPVPASDDPEAWNEVWKRLGRPDSPDGYEFIKPDALPPEFPYSEDLEKSFRAEAHKLGIPAKAAAGLYKWYIEANVKEFQDTITGVDTALKANRDAVEASLRKEWGLAYDSKLAGAQSLITAFADEKDLEALQQIGDNPAVVRFMAKIADAMGEDTLRPGGILKGSILDPASAQKEINSIMSDQKHPYFDKMHPEHQLAVERVAQLHDMAYPKKS